MKPTVGLTSRYLVIPISGHQDSVGPMAKTVKDAAYLLAAIAGKDKNDNYTAQIPWTVTPDYVGACVTTGLNGVKVGVLRQLFDNYAQPAGNQLFNSAGTIATPAVKAAMENAIKVMQKLGAIVTDATIPQYLTKYAVKANANEGIILRLDFKLALTQYLAKLTKNPNNIKNVKDLITFTKNTPAEMWPDR
jgi:amidase